MNSIFKKASLGAALAATALAGLVATPASAQPWGGYRHGGDGAGVAVAAGLLGLVVGAAVADRGYDEPAPVAYAPYAPDACYDAYPGYDGDCYPASYYTNIGWSWHDGYWWNHDGQRFARPFVGNRGPAGGYGGGAGYARGGYAGGGYHGGGYQGGGFQGGGHGGPGGGFGGGDHGGGDHGGGGRP